MDQELHQINDLEIETKLEAGFHRLALPVVIGVIVAIMSKSLNGKVAVILLVLFLVVNFLATRQVFNIAIENSKVTIKYLFFYQHSNTFELSELFGKLKEEVRFRGGRVQILEICIRGSDKVLFKIEDGLCQDDEDFQLLVQAFGVTKL